MHFLFQAEMRGIELIKEVLEFSLRKSQPKVIGIGSLYKQSFMVKTALDDYF